MKKSIFAVAMFATMGLGTFTSCSSEVNTEEGTEAYTCPMSECEDGKQYSEKGSCPVCGMNLEKV